MLALLRAQLPDVVRAAAPLGLVVAALQVTIVGAPAAEFLQFLAGLALAILGMTLLFAGIDLGILPMGRYIGAELPRRGSLPLILLTAFALGFATTIAEPDVIVLAQQVETASGGDLSATTLAVVISAGVGAFVVIAMLRIVSGVPMVYLLAAFYLVGVGLTFVAPPRIVPTAWDAGSVTTGALSSPVILALALGFISVLPKRNAVEDGFGLLGLGSIGAVLLVLLFGMWG